MKIYNEDKTQVLENIDLELGYLKFDKLLTSEEQQEESHYEEKHYDNGGVAKYKKIDKPYKPAEYEDIQVYILYTEKELLNNELNELVTWFDGYYRTQVEQYNRCQRTGAVYDKDIVALDKQADETQIRIREIKEQLKISQTKS